MSRQAGARAGGTAGGVRAASRAAVGQGCEQRPAVWAASPAQASASTAALLKRTPVKAVPASAQAKGSRGQGHTEMSHSQAAMEVMAISTADHAFHVLSSNTAGGMVLMMSCGCSGGAQSCGVRLQAGLRPQGASLRHGEQ